MNFYIEKEGERWKSILQTFFENMEKGNMNQRIRCVSVLKNFTKAVIKHTLEEENENYKIAFNFMKNVKFFFVLFFLFIFLFLFIYFYFILFYFFILFFFISSKHYLSFQSMFQCGTVQHKILPK